MENQNLNILDEVNKGATMGMDAISFVSDKVVDSLYFLSRQYLII